MTAKTQKSRTFLDTGTMLLPNHLARKLIAAFLESCREAEADPGDHHDLPPGL